MKSFKLAYPLWQDVRYGLRLMARSPGFNAIAAIILALGIGANSAVFSLMEAVMFRALPVQDAQQLVVLQWSANKNPRHRHASYGDTKSDTRLDSASPWWGTSFSRPFLQEVERSNIFLGVAAFAGGGPLALSGHGPAMSANGQSVNGDFFRTLGVHAEVGRLLEPRDDQPSSSPALVLNYGYWQRAFGSSPSVVGMVVNLNSVPFTIVGVAERKFVSLSFGNVYDLWMPMAMNPRLNANFARRDNDVAAWWLLIAARLKPGVPVSQQQAAMDLLFRNHVLHVGKAMVEESDAPRIALLPAQEALVGVSGQYADPLRVLMVTVGLVLLIASANVAGLVLSRSTSRAREFAVRLALGARRGRLLRQLLTESMMMSMIGGALGIVLAFLGARAIVTMLASNRTRPLGFSASLDGYVLAFTTVVSLLTGIFFGILPALRSLHVDLSPALKEGCGSSTRHSPGRHRWYSISNALVIMQAALAIVVLMGAGLLMRTLTNLRNIDPGFDTNNTLTFGLDPKLAGYKSLQIDNFYRELQQQIGALPGVIAVSYSQSGLLTGSRSRTSVKFLRPGGAEVITIEADFMPVGTDFFNTMKMPLLAGRTLNQVDMERAAANRASQPGIGEAKPGSLPPPEVPVPVIVNQLFARKNYPGINAVGRQFGEEDGSDPDHPQKYPGYIIVGVVQDAKYNNLRREIDPTMYVPLTGQNATFAVRTASDSKAMLPALRNLVSQHDSNLPLTNVSTQTELIDRQLEQERLIAKLSSFFAILALLLASVGLYGLLSYEVTRKTREIGIRIALGAQRAELIWMVVWQSIVLVFAGAALGVSAAIGLGHMLRKLLYGVKPSDPITLVSVALLLIVVAIVAAAVPARRATAVDPMTALRCE